MIAAVSFGLLGLAFWQAPEAPDVKDRPAPAAAATDHQDAKERPPVDAAPAQPDTPPAPMVVTRLHVHAIGTSGHDVHVACSASGKFELRLPMAIPRGRCSASGKVRIADDFKPSAEVMHAATGKLMASLKLTTAEEDAILKATKRFSHVEVKAMAFSPDGNTLAVGIRALDRSSYLVQEPANCFAYWTMKSPGSPTKRTPENWKALQAGHRQCHFDRVLTGWIAPGNLRSVV